jgi:hypothetical protein
MSLFLLIRKALTLALGCAGLIWGIVTFPNSQQADNFWTLKNQLLRSENFDPTALAATLASSNLQTLSDCDSDAQLALLLIEMRLTESSLRAGDSNKFDQSSAALGLRARRALSCAPRQSLVWLVDFSLAVLHGQLDNQSFALLALSYQTSPNEAWIAIRRNFVAIPIVQLLPEASRQDVLSEFQQLIRNGFELDASRSFLRAGGPVRSLLQAKVEQLEQSRQEAFWRALQNRGS